ncbi:MAG: Gfo/Idh/MocA family oxidoreductase [Trueperaceae bacterium]
MLGVAIVGAGTIGAAHAQGYRLQSTFPQAVPVSLVKIVDEDGEAADRLASRFSFAECGRQWEELLHDDRVDVVSLAVPNHLHHRIALALMAAGKNVLCEKPLANDVADAYQLNCAAKDAGVTAGTVFNYRRIPAVSAIRELAQRGRFGDLLHFQGQYLADYGADPESPLSWRYRRSLAGPGVLADVGSHLIDLARCCCGEIVRVDSAQARTVITTRPLLQGGSDSRASASSEETGSVDNEDLVSATLTFANGCLAQLTMSRVAAGYGNGLSFVLLGREQTVRFDYARMAEYEVASRRQASPGFRRVEAGPDDAFFQTLTVPVRGVGFGYAEVFAMQIHDYLDAASRGEPFTDGGFDDGYEVALVIAAVEQAVGSGNGIAVADVRGAVEGVKG